MGAHPMGGLLLFLRKDPSFQNVLLRSGTMRIYWIGGCDHGRRNRQEVHWGKRFGFIAQGDAGRLFFRHSAINMTGFRSLNEGDRVSFEAEKGSRWHATKSVTKL